MLLYELKHCKFGRGYKMAIERRLRDTSVNANVKDTECHDLHNLLYISTSK